MSNAELNQKPLVLVTGASGFIGRALCQSLWEKGMCMRAWVRNEAQGPWGEVVSGDLVDALPHEALRGVHTVFHLAGTAPTLSETRRKEANYYTINTEGTRKLLESSKAAGVRRFVFFSSVKAISEGGEKCLDENAECHPEMPYGRSKLEAERLVLEGGYVPEPVVFRLSMVYGSSRKGNLPRMIDAIAKGRFPPFRDVGNTRSMVHVEDVARAALLAAEKREAARQTYIVTDGQSYSTRQMYKWICEALGKPIPHWHVPMAALKTLAKVGDGIGRLRGRRFLFNSDTLEKLVGSAWYSSEKIQRELGFRPLHNLQSALPDIVQSMGLKL